MGKIYTEWEAFRVSPEIKKMLAEIAEYMRRDKSETFRTLVESRYREIKNESTLSKTV